MQRRQLLKKAKRIVVKVGSALLTNTEGVLNTRFIGKLAREICALQQKGHEVILVSSGAIAAGLKALENPKAPKTIPAKQAMAAIGQPRLMQAYNQAFQKQGVHVAQILLTSEDINDRERYAHARNALLELLKMKVVPVFNENDTVAVNEIKFGDNDSLSAHITNLAEADALILLSDVEGLYTGNPRKDKSATLLHQVEKVDGAIKKMAVGKGSSIGTGGMATKIMAAEQVNAMGEEMIIAHGMKKDVLLRILNGEEIGTIFYPQGDKLVAKKHWIAFVLKPKGKLYLDEGAGCALKERGKSLLPSGVVKSEGKFKIGDCVELIDHRGKVFARGLMKYEAKAVEVLYGIKSTAIESVLGYKNSDELIHRDDLVVLK